MTDTAPPPQAAHDPRAETDREAAADRRAAADRATAARRRMLRRRRRTITLGVALVLITSIGYTVACATASLPELHGTLTGQAESEFVADSAPVDALLAAQHGVAAVGWSHDDEIWSNATAPQTLASITKLVTALVGQEAQPLAVGADGFTHTWTAADRARQAEILALDGVAYAVPVGSEFTQRQMLEMMLLPSANDFAWAYALSIFGDTDAFLAAVDEWKARHGLDSLNLVEPSGMDSENRASAEDLVRIARLALADPALVEITSLRSTEVPGVGVVENTNPLLGTDPEIVGLKTGRLYDSGFNLVAARRTESGERSLTQVSVVLGRDTAGERADASRELLSALAGMPQSFALATENEEVGSLVTWTGETVPLVISGSATAVLVPGESAWRRVELAPVATPEAWPLVAGSEAGTVVAGSPTGEQRIPIVTAEPIAEPDLWWRLSHPALVFGWSSPEATG